MRPEFNGTAADKHPTLFFQKTSEQQRNVFQGRHKHWFRHLRLLNVSIKYFPLEVTFFLLRGESFFYFVSFRACVPICTPRGASNLLLLFLFVLDQFDPFYRYIFMYFSNVLPWFIHTFITLFFSYICLSSVSSFPLFLSLIRSCTLHVTTCTLHDLTCTSAMHILRFCLRIRVLI